MLLFWIQFLSGFCLSSESIVHEFSITHETKWGESLFVSGNVAALGSGDLTQALRLSAVTYPNWRVRVKLPKPTRDRPIFYQFLARDNHPDRLLDPTNGRLIGNQKSLTRAPQDRGSEVRLNHEKALDPPTLTVFHDFESRALGEVRTLRLWKGETPPEVWLLFHDGQNVFESVSGPKTWAAERVVWELMKRKKLRSIGIVAMDHGTNRSAEYSPNDRGSAHAEFAAYEVISWIERKYDSKIRFKPRVLIGSSLGAVQSLFTVDRFPTAFTHVIAMSGAFRFGRCLNRFIPSLKIYLDSGTVGSGLDNFFQTSQCRDELSDQGYVIDQSLVQKIGFGDAHDEYAWQKRLGSSLEWVLKDTP